MNDRASLPALPPSLPSCLPSLPHYLARFHHQLLIAQIRDKVFFLVKCDGRDGLAAVVVVVELHGLQV